VPAIRIRCHLVAPRGFRGVVLALDSTCAAAAEEKPSLQPGDGDRLLSLRKRGVFLGALAGGGRSSVDALLERAGLPADTFLPVVEICGGSAAAGVELGPEPVLRCCEAPGSAARESSRSASSSLRWGVCHG
ncbi:unnamed protein product, partial [Prorocentrum cordatum]